MTIFYEGCVERRGIHRLRPLLLQTEFPFGFFLKSRSFPMKTEILAYPPLGEILPGVLDRLDRAVSESGESRNALSEESFFGIREYRPGDNPRWIHWRSTARLQREMVKEFEREEREKVTICLDAVLPPGGGAESAEALERAISLAATLACHFQGEGHPVGLATFAPAPVFLPPAASQEHLEELLTTLARLEPALSGEIGTLFAEGGIEGAVIVVSPEEIVPPLPEAVVLTPTEEVFHFPRRGGA